MVRSGWEHDALMAMPEADFGFWLSAQLDYDEQLVEARRKAAEKR